MSDSYGNIGPILLVKNIVFDTLVPMVFDSSSCRLSAQKTACINIGEWQAGALNSYVYLPISGKVGEKIALVTVDGINISWDENRDVYDRISLFVSPGLNKYKVIVTDVYGAIGSGYISTTAKYD